MRNFSQEFRNLNYVLKNAEGILLFAHTRPDSDTVGSNIALQEYIETLGKTADICCLDPLPEFAKSLFPGTTFHTPSELDFTSYDVFIASDSVNRGFHTMRDKVSTEKVIVLIDHHPIDDAVGDIVIIDTGFSSAAEIVFAFMKVSNIRISHRMATALLLGILGDTGNLQHSSTTPQTFAAAASLIRSGAQLPKITTSVFSNNSISTLKLWGRALARAKINPNNGMIYSAITENDIIELGNPSTEDLYIASALLNNVPDAKFSLLFYQISPDSVRGSFRTEPHKGVDVSNIAQSLGGGGHKYASGFEIPGRIVETSEGWEVR
ncbi:MAG: bifunctional oligoribonuclease/PAP phosphatase NrnA [Candidatus Moranbacteria bacterium]|nr:bifunctional oligoribonuclease/PAP phosphatase NrnA [Candidatus Moranbacteria bacterium]